ncbi:hypothetical protein [Phenylobacterium terrae]
MPLVWPLPGAAVRGSAALRHVMLAIVVLAVVVLMAASAGA